MVLTITDVLWLAAGVAVTTALLALLAVWTSAEAEPPPPPRVDAPLLRDEPTQDDA